MNIPYPIKYSLYHNLTHSLIELREFNNVIEEFLAREKGKNRIITDNNDLDLQRLTQGEYTLDFSDSFPNILRSSNLTNVITSIELNFKSFCEFILLIANSPFGLKDLKGNSDFEKITIVLKKVAKIDFSELGIKEDWDFIDNSRLIRNKFVHNRGVVNNSRNESKLTKFIDEHPVFFDKYLENGTYYHIKIKKEFIYELIIRVFSLLEKIKQI